MGIATCGIDWADCHHDIAILDSGLDVQFMR
jgi:hypothetical protein